MSLKERLSGRGRPTDFYPLKIDDTEDADRAVGEARTALQIASLVGDAEKVAQAKKDLKKAETRLAACFERVTVTALDEPDYEALVDAHPPRPGNEDDESWNTDTFPKACFLACAPADQPDEGWEVFLAKSCSEGERVALYTAAIAINIRIPDPTVPKDLMGMLA